MVCLNWYAASASGAPVQQESQMSQSPSNPAAPVDDAAPAPKVLTPAAQRALAEAEARRAAETKAAMAKELNGPSGPEPTRFGDWERKGIASDF